MIDMIVSHNYNTCIWMKHGEIIVFQKSNVKTNICIGVEGPGQQIGAKCTCVTNISCYRCICITQLFVLCQLVPCDSTQ